jgi:hypothetical protein
MKNTSNDFSEKINYKLKNDEWNFKIASNVFGIRRKKKKIIYTLSSSLVTAALVLIIFTVNFNKTIASYDSFISQQTTETYKNVFKNTTSDFDTDDLITEALATR